jgi:hypothetical protein
VSAWLERLHALVPATHAGSDSSDSAPNGPSGPIGAGIAVRSEVSEPPSDASVDASGSTPEPEPIAWTVPVDGEGLPCGSCGVCGGLSFWRPIASDGGAVSSVRRGGAITRGWQDGEMVLAGSAASYDPMRVLSHTNVSDGTVWQARLIAE